MQVKKGIIHATREKEKQKQKGENMKILSAGFGSLIPWVWGDKAFAQWGSGWNRGPGMMGWGHHGMGGLGMILVVAFWIAVIVGIVFLVRWAVKSIGSGSHKSNTEDSPLEILKKRYARGEIKKEEFEGMKKDLGY